MMTSRNSSAECSSPGNIRASELLYTDTASAKLKLMLCFL
jgi:hypothetical protein